MKSSISDLKKRGYIEEIDIKDYLHLSYEDICLLVSSKNAYERTIAVRLLGNNTSFNAEVIDLLLEMLEKEKSLYTKIEICNVLEKHGVQAAKNMINLLGRIGNNQYHVLPSSVSKKVSYPLPRDIIARTLGKIGIEVLPIMIEVLHGGDIRAIREIIDAIGCMCFYNTIYNENFIEEKLMECYKIYKYDEIIRWKIVMAFSSFHDKNAICWLEAIKENDREALIREEAKRSLSIIKRRN